MFLFQISEQTTCFVSQWNQHLGAKVTGSSSYYSAGHHEVILGNIVVSVAMIEWDEKTPATQ